MAEGRSSSTMPSVPETANRMGFWKLVRATGALMDSSPGVASLTK